MKIEYIKLENYVGFYNGLGLTCLEIDFKKSRHKKIVIRGMNGSGKSELFKSLNPLPDDNSRLVPGAPASKTMILSNNGLVYEIKILHGVKADGRRETTKAYIAKCIGNEIEQLNPNGNIGSYMDLLFSEFSLDPNYVALTELTSNDRGLADMKPAERKKFINSIMSNLDFYNSIHKTLTKKSSTYKSMINNIVNKMNNLGQLEQLLGIAEQTSNQISILSKQQVGLSEQIGVAKSRIIDLDKDGKIMNTYHTLVEDVQLVNATISNLREQNSALDILVSKAGYQEREKELFNRLTDEYTQTQIGIAKIEMDVTNLTNKSNDLRTQLTSENAKLDSLVYNTNNTSIKKRIKDLTEKIDMCKSYTNGILEMDELDPETFRAILSALELIQSNILEMTSEYNGEHINAIIQCNDFSALTNYVIQVEQTIKEQEKQIHLASSAIELPTLNINCNDKSCELLQWFNSLINAKNKDISEMEANLENLIRNRNFKMEVLELNNMINNLSRNIKSYKHLFSKIHNVPELANINDEVVMGWIQNRNSILTTINVLLSMNNYNNIYIEYKNYLAELDICLQEEERQKANSKVITEVRSNILDLQSQINLITSEISDRGNEMIELVSKKDSVNELKEIHMKLDLVNNNLKEMCEKKKHMVDQYNNISENIKTIEKAKLDLESLTTQYNMLCDQINPLNANLEEVSHSIKQLHQYDEELELYNAKYSKVEAIKYYSSPSKGIQTIFMELYMNKTIELSNQLLGNIFGGRFVLPGFEINETEFNIPCIGNSIANKDISTMSSAQKSMISMILSFVLLNQASTSYNILKLDEVDGALDTENRLEFLNILDNLINILGIEQTFIISHNNEINLQHCDVIQLRRATNDNVDLTGVNILFEL